MASREKKITTGVRGVLYCYGLIIGLSGFSYLNDRISIERSGEQTLRESDFFVLDGHHHKYMAKYTVIESKAGEK